MKPRILIVDDDPGTLASLSRAFALEGYEAFTAPSAARALERLRGGPLDAILSDVVMPGMDGLELLARLREQAPGVPVILMSGQATVEIAVQATKLGALDFVEKPVGLDRLERENHELRRYWQDELRLIGDSAPMAAVRALVERAAPSDLPILVLGENGTGKELLARAVHDLSPRRAGPFVRMNCAAIPAELVESELFGSATRRARSPGPRSGAAAASSRRTGGRSSSTRSATCRRPCRRSSCASSRTAL